VITNNHIAGTQIFDAIDLRSNNDTAETNITYGSTQSGIHSDDSCSEFGGGSSGNTNTMKSNTVNEACAGILLGSGSGNTSTPNTYFNVVNYIRRGRMSCGFDGGR
jgi:hypothetical protein